jgi:hypothetical protein
MTKKIAGLGRKRPQLNIPIEFLDLDPQNPRLARESLKDSQFDLLHTLYQDFDIEELAYSMAENGYFDEEPIVVIPQKLPTGFKLDNNIEKQQEQLQQLVNQGKLKFIVVEGNRRVATVKILTDDSLRKKIKVSDDFPKATLKVVDELKIIPAIFYPNRDDISAYLGVRHIAGLLKWDAYAKAVFLASRIEDGIKRTKNVDGSIKEVQRQTADRSDVIRKQYLCYKVLREAEDDLNFDITNIKNRFSLITVALNSPSIREYIGVDSYKTVDFSKRIVPKTKLEHLEKLLNWIYGNGKEKSPIFTDSKNFYWLGEILKNKEATEYLVRTSDFAGACERSNGEKICCLEK